MARQTGSRNYPPTITRAIDDEINRLDFKARQLKKISSIMSTIKCNGLYSDENLIREVEVMEEKNAPQMEQDLLIEAWQVRKQLGLDLMKDLHILLEKIKKDMMK